MPKHCIFCRNELKNANRAKEHIVPVWLQRHLLIEGDRIVERSRVAGTNGLKERRLTLNGLLAGNCCESCNSGWMSQLETDVAPILGNLFSWDKTLNELSTGERKILGFWAVKTILALMSAGRFWRDVQKEHVHELYSRGAIPQEVHVFATHVATNSTYGLMGFWQWNLMGSITREENETIISNSYRVLLHFQNLIILVTHFPLPEWYVAVNPNRYFLVDGNKEKVKWIVPLFEETTTMTHQQGLEYFGKNVFAIVDNIKDMDIIRRGEYEWEALEEPAWSFEEIRHRSI